MKKEKTMFVKCPWVLDLRICWTVLIVFCALSLIPANGDAALIQSRLADGSAVSTRIAEIETIRKVLEKEVVTQRLADYGVSVQEVSAKLPSLSDDQIHQLAGMSTDLAAGDGVGLVIGVLLIVILVIVILMLLGKKVVVR
jgi:tetrahydromethanopterin S-methyltransferase subunit B